VNQYDSLIALETATQQVTLDGYSTQNGAYETDYQNSSQPESLVEENMDFNDIMPTAKISTSKERVNSQLTGMSNTKMD